MYHPNNMSFSRSAVTYAIVALMVLWVLLGAITLPNANRWFRGSGYSIQEDIISFNLSSANASLTMKDAHNEKHGNSQFISNVYPVDNTPTVNSDGLQGVLYDAGEACGDDAKSIPFPKIVQQYNISRIALIQQSTRCFLVDKLLFVQNNGAIGAIVFRNSSSSDSPSFQYGSMGVPSKTIEIPAYYVDKETGLTLLKDLETLSKSNENKGKNSTESVIRVVLFPSEKPVLDHWQFALIIVGAMLGTTILAISTLQCHMWHTASRNSFDQNNSEILTEDEQRQLTMDENYWRGMTGRPLQPLEMQVQKRKRRLEQAVVDLLPTRIYESGKSEKIEAVTEENSAEEKSTKVFQSVKNVSVDSFGTTCEASTCVICLDVFSDGDILRRLPCNHEYHRDCIDVWLTKKCGTCPLCQQFVEIPTVPDEIHAREEEEQRMYENMPDLAETWTGLERDEQIAMRRSPWAALNGSARHTQSENENNHSREGENINPFPPV